MDPRDSVALALVNMAPRRATEIVLAQMAGVARASAAGLFRVVDRRLLLFVSKGIDQSDLDRVHEAWRDASESVLARHTYTEESFVMVPLGGEPEGVLYLGAPNYFRLSSRAEETLRKLEPFLLYGLEAEGGDDSPVEDYLRTTSKADIEKEQLMVLLRAQEWNITGVARVMGVSRVTIYQRMKRLGITVERPLRDDK
jgi:DNA-binding NtrC family response regulator